jgi:hypothetical protein
MSIRPQDGTATLCGRGCRDEKSVSRKYRRKIKSVYFSPLGIEEYRRLVSEAQI